MITLSFTPQEKRPQQKRSMHFFLFFNFVTLTALFDRLHVRMIYYPTVKKKFSTYSIFGNIVYFLVVLSLQQLRQKDNSTKCPEKYLIAWGSLKQIFTTNIVNFFTFADSNVCHII